MIVILGASGATGSALLGRLVELGVTCRALSREPDRLRAALDEMSCPQVEVRHADAADPATLRTAFEGGTQLFLTMTNSPSQVEFESRAIAVAAESGIEHIVKLSAPTAGPDSPVAVARWHHAIEEVLRGSGLTHTLLRPYGFMQKLLHLAPAVAAEGIIVGPTGDTTYNYIDCRDIGEVAAAAFTRPEITGHTYTLTGEQTFSRPQLAALLGALLERPIRYIEVSPAALRRSNIERGGMPEWLADHIMEIQQLAVTYPEHPTDTVARILGKAPRTLESFLTEHLEYFHRR